MGSRVAGKVAVVTGSTSGIGRATAELFAEEGARVVVNDDGQRPGLGGEARYCRADVPRSDDIQQLTAFAIEALGRLDVLMNNAVCGRSASVVEQEEGDWDEAFASSVRACYLGSRFAIPHMIEAGGGSIIHTSSVHGLLAGRGAPTYDAANAALLPACDESSSITGHALVVDGDLTARLQDAAAATMDE